MNRALSEVIDIASQHDVDLRTAALIKGIRRVTDAKLARGIYP
jgi:glutamate dehydrogenase/leucine dehydrogenase